MLPCAPRRALVVVMNNCYTVRPRVVHISSRLTRYLYMTAPLQDIVEYEIIKFNGGFGPNSSIYQGRPSDAVDAAWDALYQCTNLSPHIINLAY